MDVSAFSKSGNRSTYKVPYDHLTGKVGEVRFDNSRAKYLEDVLPEILFLIITKHPNQINWIECTGQISSIILDLSQTHDFTDDVIGSLQLRIGDWESTWVDICGKEVMSHYTHIIASVQVCYFLRYYHNLYRYSNQGWAYQNSQMKNIY
jgi:hypothetical protein